MCVQQQVVFLVALNYTVNWEWEQAFEIPVEGQRGNVSV